MSGDSPRPILSQRRDADAPRDIDVVKLSGLGLRWKTIVQLLRESTAPQADTCTLEKHAALSAYAACVSGLFDEYNTILQVLVGGEATAPVSAGLFAVVAACTLAREHPPPELVAAIDVAAKAVNEVADELDRDEAAAPPNHSERGFAPPAAARGRHAPLGAEADSFV